MGINRVILIVMDSVGAGELPDAAVYGDQGSDTLGNIARTVPLRVPTLRSLGLARVAHIGGDAPTPIGAAGRMAEASPGKDSVTGHWEIAGVVLDQPFPTFPHGFPVGLIREFERRIGRATLGNTVASGTAIIDALGAEHLRTGSPIVYTSADSVFQIAAHESVIPIEQQYDICHVAFELAVREYGEAARQTARLTELAIAWDAAGRPGVDRLQIDAYPAATSPPGSNLFRARHTTFAVRFRPAAAGHS